MMGKWKETQVMTLVNGGRWLAKAVMERDEGGRGRQAEMKETPVFCCFKIDSVQQSEVILQKRVSFTVITGTTDLVRSEAFAIRYKLVTKTINKIKDIIKNVFIMWGTPLSK